MDTTGKKRKIWRILAFLLLLAGLLLLYWIGRSRTDEGSRVLTFGMFGGSEENVEIQDSYRTVNDAIIRFEHLHPGVIVTYDSGISKDDYSEWLAGKILEGQTPDVMMINSEDFTLLAEQGILENLDSYIDGSNGFDRSIFYSNALQAGQYHDTQYALPFQTVPTMMVVNKTLLTKNNIAIPESGYTLEDLYQICRRLTRDTDGDGKLDQFGIYKYTWQDAALANGANYLSEDGKCNFTSAEFKETIQYMLKLNTLNQGQTVTQENFDAGQVAFMPLTLAEYRTYKSYPYKIKKYSNFQWECIEMPSGRKGSVSRTDTLILGMNSKGTNKKLAWEFLCALTTDANQQTEMLRYFPTASVLPEVMKSSEAQEIIGADDGTLQSSFIDEILVNGSVFVSSDTYADAVSMADSEIQNMYTVTDLDVDKSLRSLQKKVQNYIDLQYR